MKKPITKKKSLLLCDNSTNVIITDSVAILREAGYGDDYIEYFVDSAMSILDDYAKLIGEGTEIEYFIARRMGSIELKVFIPGAILDPFINGNAAKKRKLMNISNKNLNYQTVKVSYRHAFGYNVITVSVPLTERKKSIFKNPMLFSIVLGFFLGVLCHHLPEATNTFIVDEIASPLMSIILNIISGIMGPVIFISMLTSIIAMDSVNDLTNLGFKIINRFIVITLFLPVTLKTTMLHGPGKGKVLDRYED